MYNVGTNYWGLRKDFFMESIYELLKKHFGYDSFRNRTGGDY